MFKQVKDRIWGKEAMTWIKCNCGLFCGTVRDWHNHNSVTNCGGYDEVNETDGLNSILKQIGNHGKQIKQIKKTLTKFGERKDV